MKKQMWQKNQCVYIVCSLAVITHVKRPENKKERILQVNKNISKKVEHL